MIIISQLKNQQKIKKVNLNAQEKIKKNILPIKKDGNSKKTTCKLKFIDSHRFMQSKLSDLVDNLSGIYNNKCKKNAWKENKSKQNLKTID